MAGITHSKVSAIEDGADETLVRPSDWNAEHTIDIPVNKNAIINGHGIVNQRVTAYTLVKDTYGICADRFYGMATGTAVSAGTFTNTAAANCGISGYAFKFAEVTLTGTGIIYFRYRMEAKDSVRFKNQTASFRCRVYQDTGGAINYTIYVRKANAADNFSAVTAISNSGAISVPNTTATSLPYLAIAMGDCSNGIEIEIKVACGAITTKNFEFTECQFELGSVATPFEFRLFEEELSLCQRYCETTYEYGTAPGTNVSGGVSNFACTTQFTFGWAWKVRKRALPTTSIWSRVGTANKITLFGTSDDKGTTVTADGRNQYGCFYMVDSGSAFTAMAGYHWHFLATCEL